MQLEVPGQRLSMWVFKITNGQHAKHNLPVNLFINTWHSKLHLGNSDILFDAMKFRKTTLSYRLIMPESDSIISSSE